MDWRLMVSSGVTLSGLIFAAGMKSYQMDSLETRVVKCETEQSGMRDILIDLHARVVNIETHMKKIVKDT